MWFYGPDTPEGWQALYRVEGARRQLKAARAVVVAYRAAQLPLLEKSEKWVRMAVARAVSACVEREVAAAREVARVVGIRERRAALDARWREVVEDVRRRRRGVRLPPLGMGLAGPAGRNRWVYEQYMAGYTLGEIAAAVGRSRSWVNQIARDQQEKLDVARRQFHMRAHLARPVDLDAGHDPRGVWLEYYPPPDPRFDSMVAVRP